MDEIEQLYTTLNQELSDPSRFIAISVPALLLVAVIISVAIYRQRRRHIDRKQLAQTLEESGASASSVLPEVSWLQRLGDGLKKTRDQLSGSLAQIFSGPKVLDADLQEKVHETLFRADLGVGTAKYLVDKLRDRFGGESTTWDDIRLSMRSDMITLLNRDAPVTSLSFEDDHPKVVLIVGVNGVGKTTTVAKLAANFQLGSQSVLLCAADTFRAAAIDQLKIWGERLGIDVIAHQQGSDPASVAFDAVKAAKARGTDVLLIDTAGRLHNKKELMDELAKINRVIAKELPGAPHETWLVIDATTGQNALLQVRAFAEAVKLSGLIVTKLDGTAKGGVVIAAAEQFKLPIRFIGVGEKADDLRPFVVDEFVDSILGNT
jgi:fused signal recognition particle receptor